LNRKQTENLTCSATWNLKVVKLIVQAGLRVRLFHVSIMERGKAPLILNLGSRWECIMSFIFHPLQPPPPNDKKTLVPIEQERWVPDLVWTLWTRDKESLVPSGTPTLQPTFHPLQPPPPNDKKPHSTH
jgi:hypothetical protein